jgi:hypothetical protein
MGLRAFSRLVDLAVDKTELPPETVEAPAYAQGRLGDELEHFAAPGAADGLRPYEQALLAFLERRREALQAAS